MARSDYIYVLFRKADGVDLRDIPLNAWTVKHELYGWFDRSDLNPDNYYVMRFKDGDPTRTAPACLDL